MNIFRQFVLFCGVGVINTAAGFGVIALLTLLTPWHYAAVNAAGYAAGLVVAFILHRTVTFRAVAGQAAARHQIIPFFALFAACYAIQLCSLWMMIDIMGLPALLGQLLAVGLYAVLNFFGSRFLVFKGQPPSAN